MADDPYNLIPPLDDYSSGEVNMTLGHATIYQHSDSEPFAKVQFQTAPIGINNPTPEIHPEVKALIRLKQTEYTKQAHIFRVFHYFLMVAAALLSITTPFLIPIQPVIAQITSVIVVLLLSIDQIFKPRERWALYSKATDLIQLQLFKVSGAYDANKEIIDTIITTESQILNTVPALNEVLQQVKSNTINK